MHEGAGAADAPYLLHVGDEVARILQRVVEVYLLDAFALEGQAAFQVRHYLDARLRLVADPDGAALSS